MKRLIILPGSFKDIKVDLYKQESKDFIDAKMTKHKKQLNKIKK